MMTFFIWIKIIFFIASPIDFQKESPQIIIIETKKMKYSLDEFSVKSSSLVEIHLTNNDVIRHNILILSPGTLEIVGKKADEMATSPDGVKKEWVPDTPEVLFYSPLVGIGEKYILKFTAPKEKGIYPFVCTFPAHWRMMNGNMIVN